MPPPNFRLAPPITKSWLRPCYLLCTKLILALLALDLCLMRKGHWQHEKTPRLEGVRRRLIGTRCSLRGRLAPLCNAFGVVCYALQLLVYSGGEESWRQSMTNLCVHGQSHTQSNIIIHKDQTNRLIHIYCVIVCFDNSKI